MRVKDLAAPCGIYCGHCHHFGKICKGCDFEVGRPFWADRINADICLIYKCCIFDKKLEHCGLCDELPCELFYKLRDPSLNGKDSEISISARKNDLKLRKRIGTEKWLELKEKGQ
jgi:hypothetical protein